MVQFTETGIVIYLLLTAVFCFAAVLTGAAVANNWLAPWRAVPYGLLLACGSRFLGYALAPGDLLSLPGFFADSFILIAIILVCHRIVRARKMVTQYPWLYESAGLFNWRDRQPGPTRGGE